MRLNKPGEVLERTHEGAPAKRINPEKQLRRCIMACMLWEDSFYESGQDIAKRIAGLVKEVDPAVVSKIAIEAREDMKLRHVPLLLAREMARLPSHKSMVAETLARIIQRPDELSEFLAIYWKDGKDQPISAQVKRGLAQAFLKFDEYSLAKYNSQAATVKLRDVLFLCHAKPADKEQEAIWKRLVDGKLATPDTWEQTLMAGKGEGKKEAWERLLREDKLKALALIRNLRNFEENKVDEALVRKALAHLNPERVLPFRFITAARHAPKYEPELEVAMFKAAEGQPRLLGKTIILVDVSGSMKDPVSGKSEVSRMDAACGVAIIAREICEFAEVFTFSDALARVPARRGFALRDAIIGSLPHGATHLGQSVKWINENTEYNRIIVITDEQSADKLPDAKGKGYVINIAAYKNGVGYGAWNHIDGWSEAVLRFISQVEE